MAKLPVRKRNKNQINNCRSYLLREKEEGEEKVEEEEGEREEVAEERRSREEENRLIL